jgi:cyanophycinase-like exopeptidase
MTARLLTVMGSGETSPTMVKVHRELLQRVGTPAVVLDTPFGFQENADEIAAKAQAYFRESVGTELSVATYRSRRNDDTVTYETMLTRLREANYVFAGPGSPSYALEQWRESSVPTVLGAKLRDGGAITFASAAALVLGTHTVPVYEIYKVGQVPHWLAGLDLVAEARLRATVIPHYDNAEGGTHDTRYSYLGERRLQQMEQQLPADVFILGVDEHTACILDLDADTATVTGLGAVTIRRHGNSTRFESGTTVPLDVFRSGDARGGHDPQERHQNEQAAAEAATPFLDGVRAAEQQFDEAIAAGDARGAVKAMLNLDDLQAAWANEIFSADEEAQARSALRSMTTRLGAAADSGLRDPKEAIAPFVEALLEARDRARDEKRFDEADTIRERLAAAGVEIRDTPARTEWTLSARAADPPRH